MMLHEINAGKALRNKDRKRLGRGESSGQGKTSGRGNKGVGQRAGHGATITHEGGATPYWRKVPKRGFSNFKFRKEYHPVNLSSLEETFENNSVVDVAALRAAKLVNNKNELVKILGTGSLSKSLTVKAHKFSEKAAEAIKAAGGQVEIIK